MQAGARVGVPCRRGPCRSGRAVCGVFGRPARAAGLRCGPSAGRLHRSGRADAARGGTGTGARPAAGRLQVGCVLAGCVRAAPACHGICASFLSCALHPQCLVPVSNQAVLCVRLDCATVLHVISWPYYRRDFCSLGLGPRKRLHRDHQVCWITALRLTGTQAVARGLHAICKARDQRRSVVTVLYMQGRLRNQMSGMPA